MADSPRLPPRGFRSEPFAWQQEVVLEVDSLSNLGAGVARHEGWVVFVPFALPGERVRAKVWKNEANCSHADLLEVVEKAPERIEPKCPIFTKCGGCQYQHLDYEKQLEWKRVQVCELLTRLAKIENIEGVVKPPIASPKQFNYRSKLTPHYQKPKGEKVEKIGFLEYGSRSRVIDVSRCEIAMESINSQLPTSRQEVFQTVKNRKRGATLLLRAHKNGVATNAHDIVEEQVGDFTFHFLAGDFFQNNPYILPELIDYVGNEARADCRYLLDAYCGSGLFGVSLASNFEHVTGIEISVSSVDWARRNAETNKVSNITIQAASAEKLFTDITYDSKQTALIIDPPRKGCSPEFLQQLFAFLPARVIYVSCNPATQMRDLQFFAESGYRLEKVQPFDLFPQTRHLECVASLRAIEE